MLDRELARELSDELRVACVASLRAGLEQQLERSFAIFLRLGVSASRGAEVGSFRDEQGVVPQPLDLQQFPERLGVELLRVFRELPEQRVHVRRELYFGVFELAALPHADDRGEHPREVLDQSTQEVALEEGHVARAYSTLEPSPAISFIRPT